MDISVVIPTFNDEKDLDDCLSSLKKQSKDFELIVVNGHSTDKTAETAERHGARVVYEDHGTRGGACNVGAEESSGDIIVFTDADATFPDNWLEKIEKKFEETGADVVGGDDIVKDGSDFEEDLFAIDKAQEVPEEEEAWKRVRGVNSAYKREVFLENKFDPNLRSIEESELHFRLRKKGHRIVFDPDIVVYHHRRRSFPALAKQFYRNGKGRLQVTKKHTDMLDFGIDIFPLGIFILLLVSLIGSIWYQYLFLVSLGVLATVSILIPLNICRKTGDWRAFTTLMIAFPARWFSFCLGYMRGIL